MECSVFVPIEPQRVLDTRRAAAVNYSGPTLGAGGALTLYHRTGGHAIVDVTGASRAGRLTSFQAERVLDTRPASQVGHTGGTPRARSTITVDLVGPAPIPAGQAATVVVNVTATNTAGPGFVEAAAGGALAPGRRRC